jgi:hypothetical protein
MIGRCLSVVSRGFIVAGAFAALVMLAMTLPATSRLAELRNGFNLLIRGQPGLFKVHNDGASALEQFQLGPRPCLTRSVEIRVDRVLTAATPSTCMSDSAASLPMTWVLSKIVLSLPVIDAGCWPL